MKLLFVSQLSLRSVSSRFASSAISARNHVATILGLLINVRVPIASVLIAILFTGCKKKEPDPEPVYGSLTMQFANKWGNNDLVFDNRQYANSKGDSLEVSLFTYYISNIRLTGADNSVYTEPQSYHLVSSDDPSSLKFILSGVPAGHYKSVTFLLGIDSTRNVSGAQTGALDPAKGHFWTWNSGYIMAKMEGKAPASAATGNKLMYHVGGFSGPNSVLKTVTLQFSTQAMVSESVTPRVSLNADLSEWFSPNEVDFATMHTVHMPGAAAKKVADNYASMFSVSKVEN